MIIPITIHGTDTVGQLFRENTWTIGVNKQGAKIATFRPLPLGGHISVINPVLGRTAKARVIWVGEKRFPEDPFEVGVELLEAQNVWGIKFPPEDWQKPLLTGHSGRAVEAGAETSAAQPSGKPAAPPSPKATAPPTGEGSTTAAKESGAPPEKNQFNLAMAALSHYAQQSEVKEEGSREALEETSGPPPPQADAEIPAGVLKVANLLEELKEKEKTLRALDEQLRAQADRFQSSHDKVEALLARTEEVEGGWQIEARKIQGMIKDASAEILESTVEELNDMLRKESGRLHASRDQLEALLARAQEEELGWKVKIEKARASLQEATATALESVAHELDAKLRKEMEGTIFRVLGEARKHLQEEASVSIEVSHQELSSRVAQLAEQCLSKIAPELQAKQVQATDQAKEQIALVVHAAALEFTEKFGVLAAEKEESLRLRVEKTLEKTGQQVLDRLKESLEERAQNAYQDADRASQQRLRQFQAQVQEETTTAGLRVKERCELEGETAKKLIDSHVDWAVESVNLAAASATTKLHIGFRNIESDFKALQESYPGKLAEISSAEFESFREKTRGLLSSLETSLQKTGREFQEKSTRDFSELLRRHAEDFLESWVKELHRQADDVVQMMTENLRATGLQIAGDTKKQLDSTAQATREDLDREAKAAAQSVKGSGETLHREAQSAVQSLKALGEELDRQAKATVQSVRALGEELAASGKTLADETAKQLSGTTQALLETANRQAQTIGEACRAQVQRTLQEFEDRGPRELEGLLQQTIETHREAILAQLRKQAENSSQQAMAELRSRAEQVVKEASDTVYRQVGVGAAVLKDWTDQARAQLETLLRKSVESFQQQLSELSQTTLEKHNRQSFGMVEDLHARLAQAAQIFEDVAKPRAEAKLAGAPARTADSAPPRPERKPEETLDPHVERLKRQQEQAVNDATEAFRKRLSAMLESFPFNPKPGER